MLLFSAPSIITTSTNSYAQGTVEFRGPFYAVGRFWDFFSDGTNLVVSNSTDASTWSTKVTLGAAPNGQCFSVKFDGENVHYARVPSVANSALIYRMGMPYSNGTIIWAAAEQTAVAAGGASVTFLQPSVDVDTSGRAWIGYVHNGGAGNRVGKVTTTTTSDGTWTVRSGFPQSVSTLGSDYDVTIPIALTENRVYVLWYQVNLAGKLWDPYELAFGPTETATSSTLQGNSFSAVANGDTVHMAFLEATSNHIHYLYRSNDEWESEELVATGAAATYPSLMFNKFSGGNLTCFYAGTPDANTFYYKRRNATIWDSSATTWFSAGTLPAKWYFRTSDIDYGGYALLAFTNKSVSPYNVLFNYFTTTLKPSITAFQYIGNAETPLVGKNITLRSTWLTQGNTITFQKLNESQWLNIGTDTVDSDGVASIGNVSSFINVTATYRAYINSTYYSGNLTLTWANFKTLDTATDKPNYLTFDNQESFVAPNVEGEPDPEILWLTLTQSDGGLGLGKFNTTSGFYRSWDIAGGANRGIDLVSNSTHLFFSDIPSATTGYVYVFDKSTSTIDGTYTLASGKAGSDFALDVSTGVVWFIEAVYSSSSHTVHAIFPNGTLGNWSVGGSGARSAGAGGFIFNNVYYWLNHGDEGYINKFNLATLTYSSTYVADTNYAGNDWLEHWVLDRRYNVSYIFHLGQERIYKWNMTSDSLIETYNCSMVGSDHTPRDGSLYVSETDTWMFVSGDDEPTLIYTWNMTIPYNNASQPWVYVGNRKNDVNYGSQTMPRWGNSTISILAYTNRVVGSAWATDIEVWSPFYLLNMTLAEAEEYDYVDNDSSNVDGSTDIGSSSDFNAQKATDGTNDTMTEADDGTGSKSNSTLINDGFEGSGAAWDDNWDGNGATTWVQTSGQKYSGTYSALCGPTDDGDLTSDDLNTLGAVAVYVSFWYMDDDLDALGDDAALYFYDGSTYDLILDLNLVTEDTWTLYDVKITDSQYFKSNFRVRFTANPDGGENLWVDDVLIIKETQTANYRLDLEEQFTDVNYTRDNEELCILMGPFSGEDLKIYYWNASGSAWVLLDSAMTANAWNNYTVPLTSATFTIRFLDATQTGDTVQSTWQKDAALLHTWEDTGISRSVSIILDYASSVAKSAEYLRATSITLDYASSASKLIELLRVASITTSYAFDSTLELFKTGAMSLTFGFTASRALELLRTASITLTDAFSASKSLELIRTASFTTTLTTSTSRLVELLRTVSFTSTFTFDALTEIFRSASMTVSTSWAAGRLTELLRTASQTLTFSFSAGRLTELLRAASITTSYTFSAAYDLIAEIFRNVSISISTSWSANRAVELLRSASQTLSLSFSANRLTELLRATSITLSTGFSATRIPEYMRAASITISSLFSVTRIPEYLRTPSMTISTAFSASRITALLRSASMTASFVFSALPSFEGIFRTASMTISFTFNGIRSYAEFLRGASQSFGFIFSAAGGTPFPFNLLVKNPNLESLGDASIAIISSIGGTVFQGLTNSTGQIPTQELLSGNYTLHISKIGFESYSYIFNLVNPLSLEVALQVAAGLSYVDLATFVILAITLYFWLPINKPAAVLKIGSGAIAMIGWFIVAALNMLYFSGGWMWAFLYVAIGLVVTIQVALMLLSGWHETTRRV